MVCRRPSTSYFHSPCCHSCSSCLSLTLSATKAKLASCSPSSFLFPSFPQCAGDIYRLPLHCGSQFRPPFPPGFNSSNKSAWLRTESCAVRESLLLPAFALGGGGGHCATFCTRGGGNCKQRGGEGEKKNYPSSLPPRAFSGGERRGLTTGNAVAASFPIIILPVVVVVAVAVSGRSPIRRLKQTALYYTQYVRNRKGREKGGRRCSLKFPFLSLSL